MLPSAPGGAATSECIKRPPLTLLPLLAVAALPSEDVGAAKGLGAIDSAASDGRLGLPGCDTLLLLLLLAVEPPPVTEDAGPTTLAPGAALGAEAPETLPAATTLPLLPPPLGGGSAVAETPTTPLWCERMVGRGGCGLPPVLPVEPGG